MKQTYREIRTEVGKVDLWIPSWLHAGAMWAFQYYNYAFTVGMTLIGSHILVRHGVPSGALGITGLWLVLWPLIYFKLAVAWPLVVIGVVWGLLSR